MDYSLESDWFCFNSDSFKSINKDFNFNFNLSFDFTLNDCKVMYNNDGTFNRLRISDEIFVSIFDKNFLKETKAKLSKKIGNIYTLIESGQKINIAKDFLNEYIYSRSARSLTINRKMIKFKIIDYLKEIVENSLNRSYEANHKVKHNIDGKYGFYKYKIKFSIVMFQKEELYEAIILIRNDADKRKYLYDILGIKKID